MSNNWIVENIQNALDTWNDKLNEIWRLLSQSPNEFKGGTVWNVMVNINGTLKSGWLCAFGAVLPDGNHATLQFHAGDQTPGTGT